MEFDQRKNVQTTLIYIYNPIPVEKVSIDLLKKEFPTVVSISEQGLLLAESPEKKIKVQIGVTRLEYSNNSEEEFSTSALDLLDDVMGAMPPVDIKAVGANLHIRVIPKDFSNASAYTTEAFLANAKELEEKLGAPLIHTASRIIYGQPSDFFDLRITPLEIQSEWLHIQLHHHVQETLADSERIITESKTCLEQTIRELDRLKSIV